MTYWKSFCVLITVCLVAVPAGPAAGESGKAWALRDHYSFKGERGEFRLDVQTAEWRVDINGLGVLIDSAWAEVELAGGKIVALNKLKSTDQTRSSFDEPVGTGTYFQSRFPAVDGLDIAYSVARFDERPFLVLIIDVTNKSDQPIQIASLKPAVFGPGVVQNLDRGTTQSAFYTAWRGGYPMLQAPPKASLVHFHVPNPQITVGIGVLQSGMSDSHIIFNGAAPSITGVAESVYDPPLELQPGESLRSDPVWITVYLNESDHVHQHHAWAESTYRGELHYVPPPHAWVTVDPSADMDDLMDTARSWDRQTIVRHALIPYGWESRPGSLAGDTPRYPKDIRDAAADLRKLGLSPGISFDPLAASGGRERGVVEDSDGNHWLNPLDPEAKKTLAKRIERLVDGGFGFFLVPETTMPSATLGRMKLTRAHAHSLAIQLMRDVVPDAAIIPAPTLEIDSEAKSWEGLAATTFWYESLGYRAGPVRFNVDNLRDIPDPLAGLIRNYHGSVEIVGGPVKKKLGSQLAAALDHAAAHASSN